MSTGHSEQWLEHPGTVGPAMLGQVARHLY